MKAHIDTRHMDAEGGSDWHLAPWAEALLLAILAVLGLALVLVYRWAGAGA